jgi:hypothetical protein
MQRRLKPHDLPILPSRAWQCRSPFSRRLASIHVRNSGTEDLQITCMARVSAGNFSAPPRIETRCNAGVFHLTLLLSGG